MQIKELLQILANEDNTVKAPQPSLNCEMMGNNPVLSSAVFSMCIRHFQISQLKFDDLSERVSPIGVIHRTLFFPV